MIRTGITALLAGMGAAGAICLPVSTNMPEALASKSLGRGQYPVRIALPAPALGVLPSQADDEEEQFADAAASPEAVTSLLAEGEDDEADLAPSRAEEKPAPPATQRGVMLSLTYDLGDPTTANVDDAATAPVEIEKHVRVNGTDVGQATIRVTSGSTLLIARDEVVSLLEKAGRTEMAQALSAESASSFISFEELRERGMNVRYDAAADRIALST